MADVYDVYVSYCHQRRSDRDDPDNDVAFAERLTYELEEKGLKVFLQEWDVRAGDSIVARIDEGIRASENAIVIVSGQLTETRLNEDYATLARELDGGQLKRLIPVIRDDDAVLPASLEARRPVSFAHVDETGFRQRVVELVGALRGERRIARADVTIAAPSDRVRVPDLPILLTLRVEPARTVLRDGNGPIASAAHGGLALGVREAIDDLGLVRSRIDRSARTNSLPAGTHAAAIDLDQANRRLGAALAADFLPEPVASVLAAKLQESDRSGRAARVAIEINDSMPEVADLPWESLVLPGCDDPVVLWPSVWLHRYSPRLGATAQHRVAGPLRILAVIASPDAGGGPLLDYEHELARILDAVEGPRRQNRTHVRILNWGSVLAIREALADEDFHVLHISCHAMAGVLLLETADGAVDRVDAARLVRDVVIPGRVIPLVVLAGCSTAMSPTGGGHPAAGSEAPLPGLARALLQHGVPAVLGMTGPVSDDYATELLACLYRELARPGADHDPLPALSVARRMLEQERQRRPVEDRHALLAEWATAALHQRVLRNPLFDPADAAGQVGRTPGIRVGAGIADRAQGDFVGRRVELRRLLAVLRGGAGMPTGVLVHGMGGVGKSSLAAELVHLLADERPIVVAIHGATNADDIVLAVARTVRRRLTRLGRESDDADQAEITEALEVVLDRGEGWRHRVEILDRVVLPAMEGNVLLLLDDPLGDPLEQADGNAAPELRERLDPELAAFLGAWLELRSPTRLVVTSRYPLPLGRKSRRLVTHHLGPLSWAETRKLMYRLPALDALAPSDQKRVYDDVGGHPRALEYFDAAMRGGRDATPSRGTRERFDEVDRRIEQALRAMGDERGEGTWWRTDGRDLDTALAETVVLASADVLLDQLRARIAATFPLAAELFEAASVYRVPVDDLGLRRVMADAEKPVEDPELSDRLRRVYAALLAAERAGTARSRADLDLPRELLDQVDRDLLAARLPPERAGIDAARAHLHDLTLLTPVRPAGVDGDETSSAAGHHIVHRWTAGSLRNRVDPDDLITYHRRAAVHHRGRADLWQRVPPVHLCELEEARYHSWAAGEREQALAITARMCTELDLAGALDAEWALCAQTLAHGSEDVGYGFFHHRQSVIAMRRGDHAAAIEHQRRALDLAGAVGDGAAVANGLQQLGTIAQLKGERQAAEEYYRSAVGAVSDDRIAQSVGARLVLATCYQRLGGLALARADEDDAIRFSVGAMEQAMEIGIEAAAAVVYADLAELAHALGEHAAAERHALKAEEMTAADVDVRRLLAAAHLQYGAACLTRLQFGDALSYLRDALGFAVDVGDVAMYATCLQLLGEVNMALGHWGEAQAVYRRFVAAAEELDDRRGLVVAHQALARIHATSGNADAARVSFRTAMRMAEPLGNKLLVGTTHLALGEALLAAELVAEAEEELGRALAVADAADEHGLALSCVVQLALQRLRGGDADRAHALFLDGLRRAERLGSRRGAAVCLLALGLIARTRDEDVAATAFVGRALRLAEADGHPRLVAECRTQLAGLARDRGDLAGADEMYSRALEAAAGTEAADLRAEVLHQQGRCRAERGDHRSASTLLRSAAEAAARLGWPSEELACTVWLIWTLNQAGEPASARAAARRAGRLAEGLPASPVVVVARIAAAGEAMHRGDLDAAQDILEDACAAARRINYRTLIADSCCELAILARLQADLDRAERSLEAALTITRAQGDGVVTMHLSRELGLVRDVGADPGGARHQWLRSAALAAELHDELANAAATACLMHAADPTPALADTQLELLAQVEDAFTALRWLRRLRAVDGEAAFDPGASIHIRLSVELVVQELAPRMSGVSAVPAVVSPTSRSQVH